MFTSYFSKSRYINDELNYVSICRRPPDKFKGKILYQTTIPQREYNGEYRISNTSFENRKRQVIVLTEKPIRDWSIKFLAPMSKSYSTYIENRDYEAFCKNYKDEVLSRLDQEKIYNYFDEDTCFLCYETNMCHRFVFSEWMQEAGFDVREY